MTTSPSADRAGDTTTGGTHVHHHPPARDCEDPCRRRRSDTSLAAVDLAAQEATLRHRPLHVVHAFIWPMLDVPLGPSPAGPPDGGLGNAAQRILDEAMARARTTAPDLAVTGEIIIGSPGPVLLRWARTAAVTVIGDRGLGGFTGLLLRSVAVQLAAHTTTPILVARGTPRAV